MNGQSEEALNHLNAHSPTLVMRRVWIQGRLVRAFLILTVRRSLTAINTVKELASSALVIHTFGPFLHQLAALGKAKTPTFRTDKDSQGFGEETDWKRSEAAQLWTIPPVFDSTELKQHGMKANAWSLMMGEKGVEHHASKRATRLGARHRLASLLTSLD